MCVNLQARTAGELLKSLAPTQVQYYKKLALHFGDSVKGVRPLVAHSGVLL